MTSPSDPKEEQVLSKTFAKDPGQERFLEELNDRLAGFGEDVTIPEADTEPVPCFVIGTPRSGTTLLMQLLAHSLEVGYIDNLAAAFWKAPVVGIRLSRKLLGGATATSFESDYGRTHGITEPHEFGYFWRELIGEAARNQADPVTEETWEALRHFMVLFGREFRAPFILKTFWAGWHVHPLHTLLPRSLLLFVERDLTETAASILLARRAYAGAESAWIGPRPAGMEGIELRTPAEEVAAQLLLLTRAHHEGCEVGDASRILRISYERLCTQPDPVLEDIRSLLRGVDAEVELRDPPPALTPRNPLTSEGPGGGPVPDPETLVREIEDAFSTVSRQLEEAGRG